MRKEADYQITDRVRVYYIAEGKSADVLAAGNFAADVLAVSVEAGAGENVDITKEVDVNGEKVTLSLAKTSN